VFAKPTTLLPSSTPEVLPADASGEGVFFNLVLFGAAALQSFDPELGGFSAGTLALAVLHFGQAAVDLT
jgi:hypothetical protein